MIHSVAKILGASLLLGLLADSLPAEPLHQVSAETCKLCHQDIYKQWKGSMHANSTALADPIHSAFYQQEVGDPTQEGALLKSSGQYPVCLQCHAPNAARDQTTKLDGKPAYQEGVNCVACHTLKKYDGIQGANGQLKLGLKAYQLSDQLQGPGRHSNGGLAKLQANGDDPFGGASTAAPGAKPNPHLGAPITLDGVEIPALPMDSNPIQLKTADACMGCHDQRNNPKGVPLCQTGQEFNQSKSQVNCLSCHMPINGGLADHSMGGGHDKGILQRAVLMEVRTETAGDTLKTQVILMNQQPHSLPTGAPFRNIYLKLAAYDRAGNKVWENSTGHPSKDDPQAYLVYTMVDDEGKPAQPPVATRLGKDSRLQPHETRTLNYDIPAKEIALVRGELYYNLMWPALVEKFKQLPSALTAPQLIAVDEAMVH